MTINIFNKIHLKKRLQANVSEITIYVIIWLFILSGPIFVSSSEHTVRLSDHFLIDWLRMLPVFALFIINSVWLIPKFLFRKKTSIYVASAFLLSLLFTSINDIAFNYIIHNTVTFEKMKREGLRPLTDDFGKEQHFAPRQSPQTQAYDNSPGRMEPRDSEMHGNIQTSEQTPNGKALAPENTPPFHPHHRGLPPKRLLFGMGFFNQILLCLLILSLNTAIKVTIKWYKDEQARREMEKEYLHSELTFLQNQISPHFFMNTLNNIHALIDINGQNAQLAIVRLSKMMRHLLYESDMGNTTLKKEIEFLESYIDLMKLRVDETIRITFSVPETYPNVKLPPLLLIPFIENAFKHGISYQAKSFIDVSLHLNDKLLTFNCTNSLFEKSTQSDPNSGIGLKNVRKRLDLLFGKTYTLTIDDSNNEFRIKLTIPVYED